MPSRRNGPRAGGAGGLAGSPRQSKARGRADKSPRMARGNSKTRQEREAQMYAELQAAETEKARMDLTLHRGEFERRTSGAHGLGADDGADDDLDDHGAVAESAALRFSIAAAELDAKAAGEPDLFDGDAAAGPAEPPPPTAIDEELELSVDSTADGLDAASDKPTNGEGVSDDEYAYSDDFSEDFEEEDDDDGRGNATAALGGVLRKPAASHPLGNSSRKVVADEENLDDEMDDVLRALECENDQLALGRHQAGPAEIGRLSEATGAGTAATDPPAATGVAYTSRMNFKKARATAHQRTSKNQRRWRDLANMIELDSVPFKLYDQSPTSEYELYIRNYGDSTRVQTGVQCGVDTRERGEQTVKIRSKTRWSQHPPTELRAVGYGDGTYDDGPAESAHDRQERSNQLGRFITKAATVCLTLLEETAGHTGAGAAQPGPAQIIFADRVTPLAAGLPVFAGRSIVAAEFSIIRPHLLLVGYRSVTRTVAAATSGDKAVDAARPAGCLCVWNTREPSSPVHVLVAESSPTCCCFDPQKACLAFGATEDGTVAVWDLREPARLHAKHTIAGVTYRIRRPTYTTDGIPSAQNHAAPIVAIAAVTTSTSSAARGTASPSSALTASFQLATLDLDGVFKTWTVVEEPNADAAGSLHELGLHPGGHVKVMPGATVPLTLRSPVDDLLQAKCFEFFPKRPNQFVVGTAEGSIVRGVRFGERHSPRQYIHDSAGVVQVASLHFHPAVPTHFLAGYSNGDVCLFHVDFAKPVETWLGGCAAPVQWVRWSALRPAVFFALTAAGKLMIWDLLEDPGAPVDTVDTRGGRGGAQAELVAVAMSAGGEESELAIAYRGGSIECYRFNERFSVPDESELAALHHFLQSTY